MNVRTYKVYKSLQQIESFANKLIKDILWMEESEYRLFGLKEEFQQEAKELILKRKTEYENDMNELKRLISTIVL